MARLKDLYKKEIIAKMKEKFGYKNNLEVPKISKVIVNVGVGRAIQEPRHLEVVMRDLAKITGQYPQKRAAKKSIAGFKLREKMEIGAMVTLRRERMYEFLDRLINIALPRVRDFRGLSSTAFDGRGNYSIGIREHTVFPEVSLEETATPFSLQVNIVTTAKTDEEARNLLIYMGFPIKE